MLEVVDAFPGALSPTADGPIIATDQDAAVELTAAEKLQRLASKTGDFSDAMKLEDLEKLGNVVVEDYDRDKKDRSDWEKVAIEALDLAAQEHKDGDKDYPWKGASNVRFPLLTTATLQFNARSYPAIVKGDEAVMCKVVGKDNGKPQLGPDGQPLMGFQGKPIPPEAAQAAAQANPEIAQQIQPMWAVPPGGKAARAQRVAEYMNTVLFYRMEDWESDTDSLLMQLPVVGCVFRKVWYDSECREQKAALVPALRIFVPKGARSCDTTPRLTEEIPDVYPYQINEKMRSGYYREVILAEEADEDNARLLLEQHRLIDLDGDGLEEPYVVTVDKATSRVLRIEANYGPQDVKLSEDGKVLKVKRGKFFVKYGFFPHPKGNFYDLGLGHLLKQLGDVVDTALNQIVDTGTAAAAGGGFIGSGVRLQARGGGSTIRFAPGEYRTVDAPGDQLRNAIVERTLPNPSPITFQVLDLILGAAQDIAGAKDVLTGDASNTGQVGTTLALIEQGLQVFNAIYKRIYRSLKEEYTLLKDNISKYGGEEAAKDYAEVLDDPAANFEADFNSKDMDIRPVSDPASVTRMQRMARAQFLLGTLEPALAAGADAREIMNRVYEAADVEEIEKIFPPPSPAPPDPLAMAKAAELQSKIPGNEAKALKTVAETEKIKVETAGEGFGLGMEMGEAA